MDLNFNVSTEDEVLKDLFSLSESTCGFFGGIDVLMMWLTRRGFLYSFLQVKRDIFVHPEDEAPLEIAWEEAL